MHGDGFLCWFSHEAYFQRCEKLLREASIANRENTVFKREILRAYHFWSKALNEIRQTDKGRMEDTRAGFEIAICPPTRTQKSASELPTAGKWLLHRVDEEDEPC